MSVNLVGCSRPRAARIDSVTSETPWVKTFRFHDELCDSCIPGQYLMIWVPGVDEIPMSLSVTESGGSVGITASRVGEATAALHRLKEGDCIGIRGPYGNGFAPCDGEALIVGGGVGVAPLAPLAESLVKRGVGVTFIAGAKTLSRLIFLDRLRKAFWGTPSKVLVATEDGSRGERALASRLAERTMGERAYQMIYTCGPEAMMRSVFDEAEKQSIPVQASLERYIKCGIGLCGHCVLDPVGWLVCKDGPVFTSEQLRSIADFGRLTRAASGKIMPIADERCEGKV